VTWRKKEEKKESICKELSRGTLKEAWGGKGDYWGGRGKLEESVWNGFVKKERKRLGRNWRNSSRTR